MKIKRQEIADSAMVGRSAVDKAVKRGTLDDESLVSIASYVMVGRLSAGAALSNVTGLSPEFERESDNCPQDIDTSKKWSKGGKVDDMSDCWTCADDQG